MFDKLFTPINEPFFAIVCNAGNIRPHPVGDMRHFSIRQTAADCCGIQTTARQISLIQPAGGHLRLAETAVRRKPQGFGAHLAGVINAVGQPMVKHIPLPANLLNTAVCGAGGVGALALFSAVKAHIAIADQCAAKAEIPVRVWIYQMW